MKHHSRVSIHGGPRLRPLSAVKSFQTSTRVCNGEDCDEYVETARFCTSDLSPCCREEQVGLQVMPGHLATDGTDSTTHVEMQTRATRAVYKEENQDLSIPGAE